MSAHTEYRPIDIATPAARIARVLVITLVLAAFAAVIAAAAYTYGRGTRMSDAAIARDRDAAVHAAVAKAVAAKGAADHQIRLKIVARHVAAQRRADQALISQAVLATQREGARQAALAYSRGRAAVHRSAASRNAHKAGLTGGAQPQR